MTFVSLSVKVVCFLLGPDLYSDEDVLSSSGIASSKPSPITPDHNSSYFSHHTLHNRPFPDSPTATANKFIGYNGMSNISLYFYFEVYASGCQNGERWFLIYGDT